MMLYEKHGRRYVPVQDTEAMNGLPNGDWLILIRDGLTSVRRVVDTRLGLETLAALEHLTDWLTEEISQQSRMEPENRRLTDQERRAWEAYCAVMGPDATLRMVAPSTRDIAERAVAQVRARLTREKGG